jgi:hypothetical protein
MAQPLMPSPFGWKRGDLLFTSFAFFDRLIFNRFVFFYCTPRLLLFSVFLFFFLRFFLLDFCFVLFSDTKLKKKRNFFFFFFGGGPHLPPFLNSGSSSVVHFAAFLSFFLLECEFFFCSRTFDLISFFHQLLVK